MCEIYDGVLEVSRWPILAVGLLLVVGSLELAWKNRRIALWYQRYLRALGERRPWLKTLHVLSGGWMGPELQQISLIFSAVIGFLVGAFLLAVGIC